MSLLSLLALECADTAVGTHATWLFMVSGWGNPATLTAAPWSFSVAIILTGIVAYIAQLFFARRLWMFSKNIFLCGIIALIALTQCLAAVLGAGQVLAADLQDSMKLSTFDAFAVWLASSAACDIFIAAGMVFYLGKSKSKIKIRNKHTLMTRLIHQSIQTGAFTAICALVDLGFFFGFETNNLQDIPFFLLGKLYVLIYLRNRDNPSYTTRYSNTVLANLNSRQSLVNAGLYDKGDEEENTTHATAASAALTDPVDLTLLTWSPNPGSNSQQQSVVSGRAQFLFGTPPATTTTTVSDINNSIASAVPSSTILSCASEVRNQRQLDTSEEHVNGKGKRKRTEDIENDGGKDGYIDDDDEPFKFGTSVLPVANLPESYDGIPQDGMQYLFTVRREVRRLPVVTRVPNPYFGKEQTRERKEAEIRHWGPDSGAGAGGIPSQEWRTCFEDRFNNLRKNMRQSTIHISLPDAPTPNLPDMRDRDRWWAFFRGDANWESVPCSQFHNSKGNKKKKRDQFYSISAIELELQEEEEEKKPPEPVVHQENLSWDDIEEGDGDVQLTYQPEEEEIEIEFEETVNDGDGEEDVQTHHFGLEEGGSNFQDGSQSISLSSTSQRSENININNDVKVLFQLREPTPRILALLDQVS
ncbi:hypothetical protein Clacol_001317 [Clathrus columnatus]|uniref:DUF6534 domain-containing protein n=1 Tax=Clathrus columnatus TaxID=1419009 RepID=A0AAV5A0L5_9AGAM|nr:hypothetical protein Clacol_001317 [Clathrus columnatus]